MEKENIKFVHIAEEIYQGVTDYIDNYCDVSSRNGVDYHPEEIKNIIIDTLSRLINQTEVKN